MAWRRRIVALLGVATLIGWFAVDSADGISSAAQTQYLRVGVVGLFAWITYEAYKIKRAVESPRFSRLAYRVFTLFLLFTVLRIFATLVDGLCSFTVGWVSTFVNYSFYVFIALLFRRQRKVLEQSEFDPAAGRRRISAIADEFFDELSSIGERLKSAEPRPPGK